MKSIIICLYLMTNSLLSNAQSIIPLITERTYNLKAIASPQDLAWDGNNFWIIDNFTFSLYKLSSDFESIDTSFWIANRDYRHLTFNGQDLVVVDNTFHELIKIKRDSLYVIKEITLPIERFITGITWDSTDFYIAWDGGWSSQIDKLILGTDSVSFVAFTQGDVVTGLKYYDGSFYYCYNNIGIGSPGIIAVKPTEPLYRRYSLPSEIRFPSGLEIVAGYFWVMDFQNRLLYKLRADSTSAGVRSTKIPNTEFLSQNYPNPFNPTTVISYQLPINGFVTLGVYDLLGRSIKTLVSERQSAGTHTVTFNASGLPSGVYFYRLTSGSVVKTKKLVMIK